MLNSVVRCYHKFTPMQALIALFTLVSVPMIALSTLLAIPLMLMNFLGGILSGIWLAFIGEFSIIGIGLLVGLFGRFPIYIALMPGFLFPLLIAKLIKRDHHIRLGIILSIPATLFTVMVMVGWCYLVFSLAFTLAAERHPIPILLWSYSVATSPWSYMAFEDQRLGKGEASAMYSYFVSLAYLLMVLMRLIGGADFSTCFTALIAVMCVAIIIVTVSSLSAARKTFYK